MSDSHRSSPRQRRSLTVIPDQLFSLGKKKEEKEQPVQPSASFLSVQFPSVEHN